MFLMYLQRLITRKLNTRKLNTRKLNTENSTQENSTHENSTQKTQHILSLPLLKLLELFACTLMLPATFIMIF